MRGWAIINSTLTINNLSLSTKSIKVRGGEGVSEELVWCERVSGVDNGTYKIVQKVQ